MEWVSVKERFPKDSKEKLLTDGKFYFIGRFDRDMLETMNDCYWTLEYVFSENVTHWADLPELPQKG